MGAAHDIGLTLLSSTEEWRKLGPLANETPADVWNLGAAERRQSKEAEEDDRC